MGNVVGGLLISGGVMAALGGGLAVVLAIANKTLYVYEDPRIDQVEDLLPGANCGACGVPGCRALAEKVVAGELSPGQCPVSDNDVVEAIAALLGIDAGSQEKRVARLACAGGSDVARRSALYVGVETCEAAALIAGGGKGCAWGCLGHGDCADVCPFDAITANEHELPVIDETKCTACANCVDACPKNLFSIHPVSHRLWVACNNRAKAKMATPECEVACIGCGVCKKDAADGLIDMKDNLAIIDYTINDAASLDAIQRCPTGAIVWLNEEGGVVKGAKALAKADKACEDKEASSV